MSAALTSAKPKPPITITLSLLTLAASAIYTASAIPYIIDDGTPALAALTDQFFAVIGITPGAFLSHAFMFFAVAVYLLKVLALIAIAALVYLGQNWSRFAYALFFLFTVAITLSHYEMFPDIFIPILLSIASLILLFLPSSNRWFRSHSA